MDRITSRSWNQRNDSTSANCGNYTFPSAQHDPGDSPRWIWRALQCRQTTDISPIVTDPSVNRLPDRNVPFILISQEYGVVHAIIGHFHLVVLVSVVFGAYKLVAFGIDSFSVALERIQFGHTLMRRLFSFYTSHAGRKCGLQVKVSFNWLRRPMSSFSWHFNEHSNTELFSQSLRLRTRQQLKSSN